MNQISLLCAGKDDYFSFKITTNNIIYIICKAQNN